jgi:hypothetical protein
VARYIDNAVTASPAPETIISEPRGYKSPVAHWKDHERSYYRKKNESIDEHPFRPDINPVSREIWSMWKDEPVE